MEGIHYHNVDGAVSYEGIPASNAFGMTVAGDSLLGRKYLSFNDQWTQVNERIDAWREEALAAAGENPVSGYNFAAVGLEREINRLEAVRMQYFQPLVCGYYDTPEDLKQAVARLEQAGLAAYIEEIERQLGAYMGTVQ